ncbi:MAG TPA: cytochrome c family protein, partial [Sphingorhabdus lacus]|nr:cytochrome c family protein [Sphingorhabdus lacus]
MDDRSNTIAGWVLAGGIAALGLSIASGMYFHSAAPHKPGYAIEGVEAEGETGPVVPLATLLASADAAKGEAVFKKCTAC